MGLAITRDTFSQNEFTTFKTRVDADLEALKQLLQREDFGVGQTTIGAEIEYYIVDDQLNACAVNQAILAQVNDPQLTVELNRFNLEYNLRPHSFRDAPWQSMEAEMTDAIKRVDSAARQHRARAVAIGILPTLKRSDFNAETMTDIPRYRALSQALRKQRGGPFLIDIEGADPLFMEIDDVTLEGASTSLQIHWRVPPRGFADYFNAVQLVTPIALALAANSPTLFGHLLWDETRIALFKQSIDTRLPERVDWHHPARVSFGEGWVRDGVWELFAEAVSLYPPIIPIVGAEDPLAVVQAGGIPRLDQLRLHQGTTWPWNRAIFDHNDGGHLRIEMRALPSGPTPADMSANAMFLIGAALAVLKDIRHLTAVLPFRYAEQNFYRAAKYGMDAHVLWPDAQRAEIRETPILVVAAELMPKIREALHATELDKAEVERLLWMIEGRMEERLSPARWQRRMLERLERGAGREEALHAMFQRYLEEQQRQRPLCEWSLSP